ncbi:hypothetical protein HPB48_021210 [Haemaphysalis longicornis]|uniref:Endonuclease/exonuclease/phosphatase domain-containing protein n=1 Tax=Haemaphysalis longicornis TaxID=44386 RepID=A0A9J6FX42_HAELO|nr:hypothetical protein HPB48_021210 [Haemaphysalis longicornis]
MPTSRHKTIWRWNCRGYRAKRSQLQAHLSTQDKQPDIIALQGTWSNPKLLNYTAYTHPEHPQLATLVNRNICTSASEITNTNIPHVFITLLPVKKEQQPLHVLNIYSQPKQTIPNSKALLLEALKIAGRQPLIIVGDINAPHEAWGCHKTTSKGRKLEESIQTLGLTLHNTPGSAIRI